MRNLGLLLGGIHSSECEVPLLFLGKIILPVPYNNFTLTPPWMVSRRIPDASLEEYFQRLTYTRVIDF